MRPSKKWEKIAAGMPDEQARREARLELGGVEQVKERVRQRRIGAALDSLLQDVRYGLRSLRKDAGFSLVVILILALGIGANTAVFNLVHAVLLRPLPVDKPQELVLLTPEGFFPGGSMRSYSSHSYTMYEFLQEHNDVFSGLLCRCPFDASVGLEGQTQRIKAEMVSGDYFSTLSVRSVVGRLITPEDNQRPGQHAVAVLSASYWKSQFNRDPEVIGKTILVNGCPMTIIGVSEAGFTGVEPEIFPQVRVPMMMTKQMIPHIKWVDLDDSDVRTATDKDPNRSQKQPYGTFVHGSILSASRVFSVICISTTL